MHLNPLPAKPAKAPGPDAPESPLVGEAHPRTPGASPPSTANGTQPPAKKAILHICRRETLRPLRDQILRLSGFLVESTCDTAEALSLFHASPFHLVLIDVEDESGVSLAEDLCANVKTARPGQCVAFVCNWRTSLPSNCPDEILRTEFDPAAFRDGIIHLLARL